MKYSYDDLVLVFFAYGFFAWVIETAIRSVKERRYTNRNLLTLPIDYAIGGVFCCAVTVFPTLGNNTAGMFLLSSAYTIALRGFFGFLAGRITKNAAWLRRTQDGTLSRLGKDAACAVGIVVAYVVIHPVLMELLDIIPPIAKFAISVILNLLLAADIIIVLVSMRSGKEAWEKLSAVGSADRHGNRIFRFVWGRLERAYPGISKSEDGQNYVFAKGLSLDKIVWVFLITALLGDIIETFYCRFVGGTWMNRSSVVFGPFSFVWGIGAVLLTVALNKLSGKEDRWVFLGSAIIGGAFEYSSSVFTELVFGTVFWDYHYMPFNIGGRTNLLFMTFFGILGLMWLKFLFPPLEKLIERFPPVPMTVATWLIVVVMGCNGLVTIGVMNRFNARQQGKEPADRLEEYLDTVYDDNYVKSRWPNLILADDRDKMVDELNKEK